MSNALNEKGLGSWQTVTVSVADMETALALWRDQFGLTVVATRDGPDTGLATLWAIKPSDIRRQVLLATGDSRHGMLHLIEFTEPGDAVRDGAAVFDWVPKNLDIYVQDMPARINELLAAGYAFRADQFSEVTAPDGTRFREIHMPAHDSLNIVLLELLDDSPPLTNKHYGAVGPLITIVPDAAREKAFVADVLDMDQLKDNTLDGPEIEAMIGLPSGAALDVSIWGNKTQSLGWLEIIEYQGTQGSDLYPRAKPPATGILQVRYSVSDLDAIAKSLQQHVPLDAFDYLDLLDGSDRLIALTTPAGLRLEIAQQR
ncbi:MAG: VOC family protein [Pseudomonadota bacterium]